VTRTDDRWWYASDPIPAPGITLGYAIGEPGAIPGSLMIRSTCEHVLVAVTVVRSTGAPTGPVSSFSFFADAGLTELVAPVGGFSAQLVGTTPTPGGDTDVYAYMYLVPCQEFVWMAAADGGIADGETVLQGVRGMVDINTATFVAEFPASTHELGPAIGEVGPSLWVAAGFTATDAPADRTMTGLIRAPAGGTAPLLAVVGTGATSEPVEIEITGNTDTNDVGCVVGFMQLMATTPVIPPDVDVTGIWTNLFTASVADPQGQLRSAPPITATNIFDASLSVPASGSDWWCVLVDADGTTVARAPDAIIGDLTETLNDITTCTVTVPLRTAAGSAIDDIDQLPAVEVQVWRGNVLWLWGPITSENVTGGTVKVTVSDAPWHLTRRHVGEPGGTFGGKPPYFHDEPVNLRFEQGSLAGWSIFRTISIGEFVGFGVPDPTAITLAPETHLPSGEPMARCVSPLDPLDNYQMFQDLTIAGPQNGRPLNVTLSGWWYLPSAGNFAPNNQRMGLLLATLLDDADLPGDYYAPQDWEFTLLDDLCPRDKLFYQECTLELPPGVDTTVHAAVCFPQGVTFIGGLDLKVDDGLLYNESPTTIAAGLMMHGQDGYFGRDDVNLDWVANTLGDKEIREYEFNQHTNLMQAITGLAREGWFDWHTSYTSTSRVMNFTARRRGGYRPGCRIRALDDGPSNVANMERRRTVGSTVVAAQMRSRTEGNHEHGARVDGLVLEEMFVADREPVDYDLPALALERVDLTSRPEIIEADTLPGDERMLYGLRVGDTTDLLSTIPGAKAAGRYRLISRRVDPVTDTARMVFHPEPRS
jgi:hypothetical protein